jgi:hypothetical protein
MQKFVTFARDDPAKPVPPSERILSGSAVHSSSRVFSLLRHLEMTGKVGEVCRRYSCYFRFVSRVTIIILASLNKLFTIIFQQFKEFDPYLCQKV